MWIVQCSHSLQTPLSGIVSLSSGTLPCLRTPLRARCNIPFVARALCITCCERRTAQGGGESMTSFRLLTNRTFDANRHLNENG